VSVEKRGMKKRILIVEDNEQNLYMFRFLLETSGYEVSTARDGVAGVERAITEKPDLILMDMQLPEIDGYEALQRIRQHVETRRIPVVAVTSYAMVGDREKILAAGCAGYIEKPVSPETFVVEVEKYFAPV
jgi:two-component system cell cycle response regulator DivK